MGAIKGERIGPVTGGIEVRSSMFAQSLYDVADNDDDDIILIKISVMIM